MITEEKAYRFVANWTIPDVVQQINNPTSIGCQGYEYITPEFLAASVMYWASKDFALISPRCFLEYLQNQDAEFNLDEAEAQYYMFLELDRKEAEQEEVRQTITVDFLEKLDAENELVELFSELFPVGAKLQDILNKFAEIGEDSYAHWLMDTVPFKHKEYFFNEKIISEHSVFFAGKVILKSGADIKGDFRASSISASEDITVSGNIHATGLPIGGIFTHGKLQSGGEISSNSCVEATLGIFAEESIIGRGSILTMGKLQSGGSIIAQYGQIHGMKGIEAVNDIKAGYNIETDGILKCGRDYGIFAGLCGRTRYMHIVRSANKHGNIMCGTWVKAGLHFKRASRPKIIRSARRR